MPVVQTFALSAAVLVCVGTVACSKGAPSSPPDGNPPGASGQTQNGASGPASWNEIPWNPPSLVLDGRDVDLGDGTRTYLVNCGPIRTGTEFSWTGYAGDPSSPGQMSSVRYLNTSLDQQNNVLKVRIVLNHDDIGQDYQYPPADSDVPATAPTATTTDGTHYVLSGQISATHAPEELHPFEFKYECSPVGSVASRLNGVK